MYIADSSISMACEWAHVFCLCVWVFRVPRWHGCTVAFACAESDFRSPVWFHDDCNPGNYLDILLLIYNNNNEAFKSQTSWGCYLYNMQISLIKLIQFDHSCRENLTSVRPKLHILQVLPICFLHVLILYLLFTCVAYLLIELPWNLCLHCICFA